MSPCDSSYLEPNEKELNRSRVQCLLDELDGKTWKRSWWEGFHPKVYCKDFDDLDETVAALCKQLKRVDVTKFSLEMQMWWRDHQKADLRRLEAEARKRKDDKTRKAALKKLTTRERRVLGLEK